MFLRVVDGESGTLTRSTSIRFMPFRQIGELYIEGGRREGEGGRERERGRGLERESERERERE